MWKGQFPSNEATTSSLEFALFPSTVILLLMEGQALVVGKMFAEQMLPFSLPTPLGFKLSSLAPLFPCVQRLCFCSAFPVCPGQLFSLFSL